MAADLPDQPAQSEVFTAPPVSTLWRRVLGWCCLLTLVGLIGLGVFLDCFGRVDRAQPAQAIVVLGAGILPDGQPGDSLCARTRQAVALYHRKLAPVLIFTGGQGDFGRPESIIASEMALAQGVPATALLLEQRSTSTRENIRNAAEICHAHGWTRVIVVSDPYHLWRARHECAQASLVAYPSPAFTCLRSRHLGMRLLWTARETLLVIRDRLLPG